MDIDEIYRNRNEIIWNKESFEDEKNSMDKSISMLQAVNSNRLTSPRTKPLIYRLLPLGLDTNT